MSDDAQVEEMLRALRERAKELECLYRVEALLAASEGALEERLPELVAALPAGWQYPDICRARVVLGEERSESAGFAETGWLQRAEVSVQGEAAGSVEICYLEARPRADEGPFLKEERRLIETIADRIGQALTHRRLRAALEGTADAGGAAERAMGGWRQVIDFVERTDRVLMARMGRRMVNHLAGKGIEAAAALLRDASSAEAERGEAWSAASAFELASRELGEKDVLGCLQAWILEDRSAFLKTALERQGTPIGALIEALQRFRHAGCCEADLPLATQKELRAGLIRRFLTDQLDYLKVAKGFLEVADFQEISERLIHPLESHGRVGGKASGLLLAARVVARRAGEDERLAPIRVPKSWYVVSDGLLDFIHANSLEDVYNRKYLDPEQIRREYAHLVTVFEHSAFSPEILNGLSVALDDLGDQPLIVRSSSLMEDRLGASFAGKYASVFVANRGSKRERLAALARAIAEVYASVFGPDPIAYRSERGLLDLHEEMGVMIQPVVGRRLGDYFLPAFSGVALSRNEFRWSPRIRREDGLLRLVPGLGTRAVDRVGDYPILVAPGAPALRVNATLEEALRYSPRGIDVIDLEARALRTLDVSAFLRDHGGQQPAFSQLVAICDHDHLRRPIGPVDFARARVVVNFDGLLHRTPFVAQMQALLEGLQRELGSPVDIEFASDGDVLYLLQCRPQISAEEAESVSIPRHLPDEDVLFSAHRYVSGGRIDDLTHTVYVDPERYRELDDAGIQRVARAVGALNRLLPKRRFALLGPGRWGSRADPRLGVPVGYADISNTALLVEIARQQGGYVPDLSFGTHFFQDLVESEIRYLPLYPDEPGARFNEAFLRDGPNSLAELAPEFRDLAGVVTVIDVGRASGGRRLCVLMSSQSDEALGFLRAAS